MFREINKEESFSDRERIEQGLDFDKRNYTDGAWWSEQDAELVEEERQQIEAKIQQEQS